MTINAYVAAPSLIFALVDDRAEFDKIKRPVTDPGEKPDGGGHVIIKSVEQDGCTVVFQHWIKMPATPALDLANKRKAAQFAE